MQLVSECSSVAWILVMGALSHKMLSWIIILISVIVIIQPLSFTDVTDGDEQNMCFTIDVESYTP